MTDRDVWLQTNPRLVVEGSGQGAGQLAVPIVAGPDATSVRMLGYFSPQPAAGPENGDGYLSFWANALADGGHGYSYFTVRMAQDSGAPPTLVADASEVVVYLQADADDPCQADGGRSVLRRLLYSFESTENPQEIASADASIPLGPVSVRFFTQPELVCVVAL